MIKKGFPCIIAGLCMVLMTFVGCNEDIEPDNTQPSDPNATTPLDAESQVPVIRINTLGAEIQNEPKIPAEMTIYVGDEEIASANIGIEYRGSTSFRISEKKSFGIETWDESGNDIDMSFFGFPEEEDWILQGHVLNQGEGYVFDRTLMYHYLGYQLSNQAGKYASRCEFVELILNEEYLGVYVFMEKLKRDANRIDIASLAPDVSSGDGLTGGYILKIDKTAGGDLNIDQPLSYFEQNWEDDARYSEAISFRSNYDIYGDPITIEPFGPPYHSEMYLETYFLYEYPKAEEINQSQKEYIQGYIDEFETALLTDDFTSSERTYTDYIDINSFVDYFLMTELVRNVDGYRLSTYLQKDRGGKLEMGPIWDLNIGYDTGGRIPWNDWVIYYNQYVSGDPWMMLFWWPRLIEDPIFREAIKNRWTELRSGALSDGNIQGLVMETADYLVENGAVERNYNRWSVEVDYNSSIQSLIDFLDFRANWMDEEIASFLVLSIEY